VSISNRLHNAFKTMDLFIKPSPTLLKRIMILLDKKIMNILYGYSEDDYYSYEFHRLKLSARKAFIGEQNGLKKIAKFLNDPDDIIKFDNKIIFNKLFAKYLHRDWLAMNECTFNEFLNFCSAHSDFIKKPVNQYGGSGIEKHILPKDADLSEHYNKLKSENCLIEEIIIQDKEIASFNPDSVNTCRIYSIVNKSKVIIIDAYLRMGVGDVVVDNQCMGGIAAKIDVDTGIITTHGKNIWIETFASHPYTHKQIIGFQIPGWGEIKKLIEEAASVVPTVRYVAWDVVINNKGDICIIEGNDKGSFMLQESTDLQGKKAIYEKLLQDIN
jgi:hypothetical protein